MCLSYTTSQGKESRASYREDEIDRCDSFFSFRNTGITKYKYKFCNTGKSTQMINGGSVLLFFLMLGFIGNAEPTTSRQYQPEIHS